MYERLNARHRELTGSTESWRLKWRHLGFGAMVTALILYALSLAF